MEEIKICIGCEVEYISNSPKQKFHSAQCKNKFNHQLTKEKMEWEILMIKKRKKNIKILEGVSRKFRRSLTKKELQILGFDLSCAFLPIKLSDEEFAYRFGSKYLIIFQENTCKILTKEQFEAYVPKTA